MVPGAADAGRGADGTDTLGSAGLVGGWTGTLGSAAPGTEGSVGIRDGLPGGTCLTGTLGSGLVGSE